MTTSSIRVIASRSRLRCVRLLLGIVLLLGQAPSYSSTEDEWTEVSRTDEQVISLSEKSIRIDDEFFRFTIRARLNKPREVSGGKRWDTAVFEMRADCTKRRIGPINALFTDGPNEVRATAVPSGELDKRMISPSPTSNDAKVLDIVCERSQAILIERAKLAPNASPSTAVATSAPKDSLPEVPYMDAMRVDTAYGAQTLLRVESALVLKGALDFVAKPGNFMLKIEMEQPVGTADEWFALLRTTQLQHADGQSALRDYDLIVSGVGRATQTGIDIMQQRRSVSFPGGDPVTVGRPAAVLIASVAGSEGYVYLKLPGATSRIRITLGATK